MDPRYICYCGLYCENCATKARVEPAARVLYDEMRRAGFGEVVHLLPDGDAFWAFLEEMATRGCCGSCSEGGGNPGCAVRRCAQEKSVEVCAVCGEYPCHRFEDLFAGYPMLRQDNALLRYAGADAWAQLQDERRAAGYTYTDATQP